MSAEGGFGHTLCALHPFFGVEGTRKAKFCSKHATKDIISVINVVSKSGGQSGCATVPSLGWRETRKENCDPSAPKRIYSMSSARGAATEGVS